MKRLLRRLALGAFWPLDRVGVHLLPKHYYTPVPDYAWLARTPDAWRRPVDVDFDLDSHVEWLGGLLAGRREQAAVAEREAERGRFGLGFGRVEGQVLHAFVQVHRPARIVEVGGGVSTAIMAAAAGAETQITTIEPYPSPALRSLARVELREEPSQLVPQSVFDQLRAGDLLFVDSTHVVKTGSEVLRLYLEVVPKLPSGVFVHIHDVMLPYLYHREFGRDWFDRQETSLVLALLTGNERLEVLCCLSALHYERRRQLHELFPDYDPQGELVDGLGDPDRPGDFPSSLWLRTR